MMEIKEINKVADDLVNKVQEVVEVSDSQSRWLKDNFILRLQQLIIIFRSGPTHEVTDISGR